MFLQLIVTESGPTPRPTSVTTTLTALDGTGTADITKTHYVTYTYLNTYLEKGSTVVRTNVATSTDLVREKAPKKTTSKSVLVSATPEPIQIFATKTYLTTFTYFTTLLQVGYCFCYRNDFGFYFLNFGNFFLEINIIYQKFFEKVR